MVEIIKKTNISLCAKSQSQMTGCKTLMDTTFDVLSIHCLHIDNIFSELSGSSSRPQHEDLFNDFNYLSLVW